MHELSLVASMFETILEQARVYKAARITGVKVQVGALAGVVPDLLETAFDSYKKGTIAENAVLTVVKPAFTVRCRACAAETVRDDFVMACADCGSSDLEITHGMELILEKIEMETDDPPQAN